ncbi:hypothetical protein SLE2022_299650 [Rubroshorea leprosula]
MRTLQLFTLILWLSALLLFFGRCDFVSKNKRSSPNMPYHGRKVLAIAKFDFTPLLHHKDEQQHHDHRRATAQAEPVDGNQIDPRYGVEKRLVPTGPNPLHH